MIAVAMIPPAKPQLADHRRLQVSAENRLFGKRGHEPDRQESETVRRTDAHRRVKRRMDGRRPMKNGYYGQKKTRDQRESRKAGRDLKPRPLRTP